MRGRGMAARRREAQGELRRARHDRAVMDHHLTQGHTGPVVQTENLPHRKALQQPVVQHHPGPAIALLGVLEDQMDLPRKRLPLQDQRCAKQDRHVAVVAAGMHDAGGLRLPGQAGALGDRQSVHVGAQANGGAVALTLYGRHHAMPADPGYDRQSHLAQLCRDIVGCPHLGTRQFRMLVQVMADCDQSVEIAFGQHRLPSP